MPPVAEAFTAGPVDIPVTASAAAVRTTILVCADVTATAPDAEALTEELLVCGEPECENQLCFHTPCCLPGVWSENLQLLLSHPLSHSARLV